jgi:hypothetical protein
MAKLLGFALSGGTKKKKNKKIKKLRARVCVLQERCPQNCHCESPIISHIEKRPIRFLCFIFYVFFLVRQFYIAEAQIYLLLLIFFFSDRKQRSKNIMRRSRNTSTTTTTRFARVHKASSMAVVGLCVYLVCLLPIHPATPLLHRLHLAHRIFTFSIWWVVWFSFLALSLLAPPQV